MLSSSLKLYMKYTFIPDIEMNGICAGILKIFLYVFNSFFLLSGKQWWVDLQKGNTLEQNIYPCLFGAENVGGTRVPQNVKKPTCGAREMVQ